MAQIALAWQFHTNWVSDLEYLEAPYEPSRVYPVFVSHSDGSYRPVG